MLSSAGSFAVFGRLFLFGASPSGFAVSPLSFGPSVPLVSSVAAGFLVLLRIGLASVVGSSPALTSSFGAGVGVVAAAASPAGLAVFGLRLRYFFSSG